jgi:prevent-host-death family protein
MTDKHMGVAEVKRNFADVLGQVMFGKQRIIVERRGRPVVAIVPLEEPLTGETSGTRLAAAAGFGEEAGEAFYEEMQRIIKQRRERKPRLLPKGLR